LKILVTGGAGFIGSNIAAGFSREGNRVAIVDDLSRPGGGPCKNLEVLTSRYRPEVYIRSVVDFGLLVKVVTEFQPDLVVHCAAQTNLRSHLRKPYSDFRVNALGTLNVLEAAKISDAHCIVLSSNVVYGSLNKLPIVELPTRYDFPNGFAISENQPVNPHIDPYSLSKTTADYYARLYGATVFRCSSIYGPGQWPIPGQGWIGILTLYTARGEKIEVAGDGKQVRDILHVDDLVALIEKAADTRPSDVFNVGGGRDNTLSMLELFALLRELGLEPKVSYTDWHTWTEKVYISDISKIKEKTGWKPTIGRNGVKQYIEQWLLPVVLRLGSTQ